MKKDNIVTMRYPRPHFKPQAAMVEVTEDDDEVIDRDLGYIEGEFSDSRPYRVECWCVEEVRMATIYFSDRKLKDSTKEDLLEFLEQQGLVRWLPGKKNLQPRNVKDELGRSMWAINIKLQNGSSKYAEIIGEIIAYEHAGDRH